jgi:hypothetical protein
MKTIFCVILSLFLTHFSFAGISYHRIDTLNREQGIDFDSNALRQTGKRSLILSPYAQGPYYDSAFNADFVANPAGLLSCSICDANFWLTFFRTYKCKTTFDNLARMDSLVLADTSLFQEVLPFQPNYSIQIFDTVTFYIVESNQHRFSIFRIIKQIYWDIPSCDPCPPFCIHCPMAFEVEWWYQDDGSLNFKNATRVQQRKTEKSAYTPLKIKTLRDIVRSGMPLELYTPSGRFIGRCGGVSGAINVSGLPSGILIYKVKQDNQSPFWGKVLVK